MTSADVAGGPRRLNRPKDKDELLQELTDEGPFSEFRDVLVFAAALGYYEGRRVPFADRGESIRWETATNRRGTEALVNLIGVAEAVDPEILAEDRFDERLRIFEEYANGGLEILGALLARDLRPPSDVIRGLVHQRVRIREEESELDLSSEAESLDWA